MLINPYVFNTIWTPAQISTALWLDATVPGSITLASGTSAVSQWNDKSGNNRHATQASSSERPTYSASINGVTFSTTPTPTIMTVPLFNTNNVLSLYSVVTFNSNSNNQCPFYNGLSSNDGIGPVARTSSSQLTLQILSGGVAFVGISPTYTFSVPKKIIIGMRRSNSTTGNISYNGTSSTFNSSPRTASSYCALGQSCNATLHEAVAVNSYVSDADNDRMVGSLAWKHGLVSDLPSGHPYKNSPPV